MGCGLWAVNGASTRSQDTHLLSQHGLVETGTGATTRAAHHEIDSCICDHGPGKGKGRATGIEVGGREGGRER